MAFYRLFPWDYGTALLASLISNIMRSKDSKPVQVGDYMPADHVEHDPLEAGWDHLRSLEGEHGEH